MSLEVAVDWRIDPAFRLQVDLQLPAQGVTALFGRSGCGKTSLLRVMAGLERIAGARVCFRDQQWQAERGFVPLHRRRVGLVFQEHSLMVHLSVKGNLLYGFRRTPEPLRRHRPAEVAAMLGLEDLLDRPVDRLSGGQRQRVALGRALLSSPQLLLLDEPLSALDTQTRREIMPFFGTLATQADVPIILVTHAPDEVQALADRVVFMSNGRVDCVEDLKQALARPDSPLFSDAGAASVIEGRLLEPDVGGFIRFGNERVQLRLQTDSAPNRNLSRLRIQANDVAISRGMLSDISIINQLPILVEDLQSWRAGRILLTGRLADGQRLSAEITEQSCRKMQLAAGQSVYALIKAVALIN